MTTHVGYPDGAALMTAASLDELRSELEQLRRSTLLQVEQSLPEEQMVLEARLAALEDAISRAVVVDNEDLAHDAAVIGSTLTIEDLTSGRKGRYRLQSAHDALAPDAISASSPLGQALMGARPGAVVTVDLPNGRARTVRLIAVTEPAPSPGHPL
jgi:transcription elongation GreA/GreB family factor